MQESEFSAAFDVFTCIVPHVKNAYAIPMELLTTKLATKMTSIPDAVYLAKCDAFQDGSTKNANSERYLMKFGAKSFEGFGKPTVMGSSPMGSLTWSSDNFIICFTPRVSTFNDEDHVVLDVLGMCKAPDNSIGDDGGKLIHRVP